LGVREGSSPDQLLLSNAALALLVRAAKAKGPVLLVVDDLPWLDRPSAVLLGFVARRLAGSRAGFLAASRSGEDGFFDRSGLPVHQVLPLSEATAAELVGDRLPALAPVVRQRLLDEAQGNPLALLELPVALTGTHRLATVQRHPRCDMPVARGSPRPGCPCHGERCAATESRARTRR
jgi:predicted ATPase